MGRAARLKRERRDAPTMALTATPGRTETIRLANPVSQHFASFIIGNALSWEARAHDSLLHANREAAESIEPYWGLMALIQGEFNDRPAYDAWQRFRRLVDEHCPDSFVAVQGSGAGKHVVICGAGPSLAEEAAEWVPQGDQVWGCNSALTWLIDHGYQPTHGMTVDQTPEMVNEWMSAPDVEYLVASTIHPHLTDHLVSNGRRMRWFHNFVGITRDPVPFHDENGVTELIAYEDWLYMMLFPGTVRCGSGLNTVTRAIDLALYMGFDKITVLGADCAMRVKSRPDKNVVAGSPEHLKWLREQTIFHADGGHALASNSTAVTMGAEIDPGTPDDTVRPGMGRWYESKPDLLISARWLLAIERRYKGRVNIVGDTYVSAIRHKNEAFLKRLPAMQDSEGNPIDIELSEIL